MFTDFEYADKRLSDFGWVVGHIGGNSGVVETDIGCDITFNTVKNNHSSIHYVSSTSYDNVCTPPSFDIFKNPCGKNQEDMYATNDEVSALTKWLNRHGYRKFKPVYNSDDSDIHYYGSFNVKKKIINDRIVGLVLTFNSNAPYGFGEQIINEVDMDNNELTASGEFIHVEDSAESKIVGFSTQGNTKQKTTEGKNLWDKEYANDINNWILKDDNPYYKRVAVYVGKDNDVTISYPTPPTGLANLYVCVTLEDSYLSTYKTWLYNKNNDSLIVTCVTLNSSMDDYIYMWCLKDGVENGNFMQYIGENLQIEYGSEATELEEYTGRMTSPNMEYNQEVMHSGIYNEETERYEIRNKALNTNIFNSTYRNKNNIIWSSGCTTTEHDGVFTLLSTNEDMMVWNTASNDVYYGDSNTYCELMVIPSNVSEISVTLSNEELNKNFITFYDENKISINTKIHASNKFTQAVSDGAKYFTIRFGKGDAVVEKTYETTVMVNYGKPISYIKHTSQSLTLTFKRPITMWDKIIEQDGQIGWAYRGKKRVFDGTENWMLGYGEGDGINNRFEIGLTNIDIYAEDGFPPLMFCNAFTYEKNGAIPQENHFRLQVVNNTKGYALFNPSTDIIPFENIDAWKDKLQEMNANGTPLYIEYQSLETEFVPLPQEEQEAIRNLMMYSPITNISNDQGMQMEITYLQDYDNEFTICGEGDEYTTLYPNISITCKRDGDLRIKNTLTGNVFEVLSCSKGETIYVNGEHKYIDSDNENHKRTTLFNDFNYNYLDINISENDFDENIYETSMPCKIVIDYSPIRKVGV